MLGRVGGVKNFYFNAFSILSKKYMVFFFGIKKFKDIFFLLGRPGQSDTGGKMKQCDFSNDDAIYDVSYSN